MNSYEMTQKMMKKMQSGKRRNEEYDETIRHEEFQDVINFLNIYNQKLKGGKSAW